MALVRTFVAIDLDSKTRNTGQRIIKTLSSIADGVRWANLDTMHLTLKFLGEVDDRELHDVCRITSGIAEKRGPFSIECKGVSAFPSVAKATTIWMGMEDETDILLPMQEELESQFCERLGVPAERRPYRPHVTLGRITARGKQNHELTEFMESQAETEFGILRVEELVVYSSELTRNGPIYTVLARCPLSSN